MATATDISDGEGHPDMSDRNTKVLGYVSVQPGTINVLCDGDACIVAGSEALMRGYIAAFSLDAHSSYEIRKARYGQVRDAMHLGGVYSFDAQSFPRFAALARGDGLHLTDFAPAERSRPQGPAISLMRVWWIPVQAPAE